MSRLLAVIAATATIGVLWHAGEAHRANCIANNRQSCSVLPWDAGHPGPARKLPAAIQRQLDEAARR